MEHLIKQNTNMLLSSKKSDANQNNEFMPKEVPAKEAQAKYKRKQRCQNATPKVMLIK